MLIFTWILACASPEVGVRDPGAAATASSSTTPTSSIDPTEPTLPSTEGDTAPVADTGGPCPANMALVEDFCIDRYEAHLEGWSPYEVPSSGVAAAGLGEVPQGYISGEVAAEACAAAGKRLCALDEWMRACEGPDGWTYPYGDTYDPSACNDTYDGHPIIDLFGPGATFSSTEMNDPAVNQLPDSLAPSGSFPGCVSAEGVYDLHGNLHEWIDDPDGTFKGGFYVDAVINGEGCGYRTTAHSFDYHDYSTGFRCCADP